jgi:hypothetical protein
MRYRAVTTFAAAATLAAAGCGGSSGHATSSNATTQENVQSNVQPQPPRPRHATTHHAQPPTSGAAPQGCPAGTTASSSGCTPVQAQPRYTPPAQTPTPRANTPQGRSQAQQSPDCQNNPPPPGYNGPLQC